VLKTSSVSTGSFDGTENKRLPATIEPDPRWIIRDGDLLVVRGSGSPSAVGQAAVAEVGSSNLLLSDLLYRVRLLDANPAFVADALRSRYGRGQLEASIRTDVGMTRKIRSDDLAGVLVPAAPRSAQDDAVEALRRQEDRLASLGQRLYRQVDLLAERRQALITAAVTGQIEIPGVAA
jgi:type I restriction enzyme S subunit